MNARSIAKSVGTIAIIIVLMMMARGFLSYYSDVRVFDMEECRQFEYGLQSQQPYVELSVREATRAYYGTDDFCPLLTGAEPDARDKFYDHLERLGYRTSPDSANQHNTGFQVRLTP